jgi:hypothetical protein
MNSQGEPDVDPLRLIVKPRLRAPVPRHEQVIRPRLVELPGDASNRRITVVGTPAGYGKTTLLAQWLRAGGHTPQCAASRPHPFAVVSSPLYSWLKRRGLPSLLALVIMLVVIGAISVSLFFIPTRDSEAEHPS